MSGSAQGIDRTRRTDMRHHALPRRDGGSAWQCCVMALHVEYEVAPCPLCRCATLPWSSACNVLAPSFEAVFANPYGGMDVQRAAALILVSPPDVLDVTDGRGARLEVPRSKLVPSVVVDSCCIDGACLEALALAGLRHIRPLYQKEGRRVTWETTWTDLLPDVAPPELAEFYGARSVDYCPEIDTSAAFVGVTYEPVRSEHL